MVIPSKTASFLIQDVRIFDGESVISNGSVLVEDGKIKKVIEGSIAPSEHPATVFSKPGNTLIPGLVDGHVHAHHTGSLVLSQSIKFGVTTVCDMHIEEASLPLLREATKNADAADFKTATSGATTAGGWPEAVVTLHNKSPEVCPLI